MKKDVEHYLHLRYPMKIVEAEEGGYVGGFPDLPGCVSQGETIEEVVKNLEDAKRSWIEVRLEDGLEVPPPRELVEEYSGRFLMRVPKSVHRELAVRARREGTSLNQYVLHLLSLALGREEEAKQIADLQTKEMAQELGLLDALYGNVLTSQALSTTWHPFPPRHRWIFEASTERIRDFLLLWGKQEELLEVGDQPLELTDSSAHGGRGRP